MKKGTIYILFCASSIVFTCLVTPASAATKVVDGKASPWDPELNSSFDYGESSDPGRLGATIIDADDFGWGSFTPGYQITVAYQSGTVVTAHKISDDTYWPYVDADGYTEAYDAEYNQYRNDHPGYHGGYFPSKYMPDDWDTFLAALVGTFTDAGGNIIGDPFEIGATARTLIIPSGAAQLQLGINDEDFSDNDGSFLVNISGIVPIPATILLLGSGIAGIVGIRRKYFS